jgi:hypothetical protein
MSATEEKQRPQRFVPTEEMRRSAAAETDRIVREQIAREAQARSANMARLRQERLAKVLVEPEATTGETKPPKRRALRRIIVR